ncbi:MAG: CinA family nicotinamide mononucleotide deamidase-related protein [Pseudomonadota bacterium]
MRIELICTGDEVLSGKTVNRNYSHVARRLQESGLEACWGTTVGDDRSSLTQAFRLASDRADAVIVNGGLGPTVDDLSQEVAAEAAGVDLELHPEWLANIEAFYTARGRVMPPNNRKQAMLPVGSEFIDNPIGTACGFALDIDGTRFFFTPGVPRELHRMLDEQILPRLLAMTGAQPAVSLRRFHSFGLGESRVDDMLRDVEQLAEGGEVKLGFQAHYPQLETKLFAKGTDAAELERRMAPVVAAVTEKLGGYLLAEDAETLEGNILAALAARGATLAVAESATHAGIAQRLLAAEDEATAPLVRRTLAAGSPEALAGALSLRLQETTAEDQHAVHAGAIAEAVRGAAASDWGLASVVERAPGRIGWVHTAVSSSAGTVTRSACLIGSPERARVGGVEMALDGLRRTLSGLSVDDIIDFEKRPG